MLRIRPPKGRKGVPQATKGLWTETIKMPKGYGYNAYKGRNSLMVTLHKNKTSKRL